MTMGIRTLYFVALLGAACSSEPDARPPTASSSASVSASAVSEPRTFGPLWERAASSADEADLARLALDEGASGLLSAIDDPSRGRAAMRALVHAPDRDLAIGPLAARVRADGGDAALAAEALGAVLALPGSDRERLDPDGERQAVRDLLSVANDRKRPIEIRARAAGALRKLAERGLMPAAEIPEIGL